MYGILPKYQAHASDESVIAFGENFLVEIDEMEHTDIDACYILLFPKAAIRPTDLTAYLSFPTLEREFAVVSELVETGATHPKNIPTKKEASQLEKIVAEALARRYSPEDLLALAHPQSPEYSHAVVCRMFHDRFEEILRLPVRDRAQLLRFLLAFGSAN
jgi:hypothetical protein